VKSSRSILWKRIAGMCLCLGAAGGLAAQSISTTITGSLTLVSGPDPLKLSGGTFTATTSIPATNAPVNPGTSATYTGLTINLKVSTTTLSLSCTNATVTVTASPSGDSFNVTSCPLLDNSSFTSLLNFAANTIPSPIPLAFSASSGPGSQASYVCGLGAPICPTNTPTTLSITGGAISAQCSGCPSMTLTPPSVTLTGQPGGTTQSQSVTVATGGTPLSYALVTSGASWLSVSSPGGLSGGSFTVSANPLTLSAGTYTGSVKVYTAASNSPQTFNVTFNVISPPSMVPSPASLTFTSNAGAVPNQQTINLTSTGAAISYNVAANTTSGGNWLAVSPGSGTTPGSSTVSINSSALAGLAAGTYSGNVVFTATTSSANSPLSVPVTLNVTAALAPSPTSLTFNYTINGALPAAQPVGVTSNGAAITYTAAASTTSGGNWLQVSPGSATTPIGVSVSVGTIAQTLAAGTYSGTVTLTSSAATNSPVTIPVTLKVSAQPTLSVLPTLLTFAGQVGGSNPASQTLSVSASPGSLNFTATASTTSGGNWLSVSPGSGTTNGSVTVSVSTTGLAANTYQGSITIASSGAANTPIVVPVTLTIGTNVLSALPASLSFAYQIGSAQPASQNVSVASTGAVLNLTATPGASWVGVVPTSTTTPATLAISVNTTGLAPGTYSSAVSISAANASNSPLSIPVTLTVTPAPALVVTPGILSFSYQTGASIPGAQSLALSTNNGASATFSASATTSSGGNWLTVSPTGGSTPASLMVSLNQATLANLAAGNYTGTVALAASGFAPQSVSVSLAVTKPAATIVISGSSAFTLANTAGPASSVVKISASDGSAHSFTAVTGAPAKWLTFVPTSGTTPGSITLTANPTGLTPGTYFSTITVTVPGTADGTKTITVQLSVPGSNLTVTPPTLSFTFQPGGQLPAAQTVAVSPASGTGTVAIATVSTNAPWLRVSQLSSAPGNVTVTLSPGLLQPGTYVGNVYITGVGSPGPSVTVGVSLTVNAMPQLTATPASLSFNYEIGSQAPAPQSLALTTNGVPLTYAVTSPGTWLSVSPARGTTPGTALVMVNPAGLGPGSYNGTISASAYGASGPISIPVTLNVLSAGQQLVVSPSQVSFAVPVGGPAPAAQTLSVSSAGTAVSFTTVAAGGKWLSVTPASGTTPGSLSVTVNPAGLTDGTYTGSITVSPAGLSSGGQVVMVTLKVGTGISTPSVSAVINAASGATGTVAPGMVVAIFGQSLGPQAGVGYIAPATGQTIATTLGGTQVLFDGVAVPLLYTQNGQVNAIAPFELAGKATTVMQVEYNNVKSAGTTLQVAESMPGLFAADGSGKGPGAILNQDFSLNSSSNPAAVGSAIMLYGTGGGLTDPASTDGQINPLSADVKLALDVHVTIGGQAAQVLYAGAAPDLPAGLIQINAVIPDGTPSGNQPVVVQIGTASTTQTVTVAVK
jgi:uncharacterized protein (TIGR03437 family)